MSKIHTMFTVIMAATLATAACCNKEDCKKEDKNCATQKDPAQVVLSVNGKKLTRGEVDASFDKILATAKASATEEQLKTIEEQIPAAKQQYSMQFAQTFLIKTVMQDAAKNLGYKITDAEINARLEEILKNMANMPNAPKTIDEALAKHPAGKEAAIEEISIGMLVDKMIKAEVVDKDTTDYTGKANEILADMKAANDKILTDEAAKAKIEGFKKQLDTVAADKKAALFADLAKANSACPSGASKGGDLGEFGRKQMVPEFEEVAFKLKVGEISEPVKTSYGYHLIMVTKKDSEDKVQASHILIRTGEKQELPKIEVIIDSLKREANNKASQKFVMDLIQRAKIEAADEFKALIPPAATEEKKN